MKNFPKSGSFEFKEGGQSFDIPIPDRAGKPLRIKIMGGIKPKGGGKPEYFKRGKVVWVQQSDNKEKVILMEELIWPARPRELRFGYRTTTHKKGIWWWGESALIAPENDIKELLNLARRHGLLASEHELKSS